MNISTSSRASLLLGQSCDWEAEVKYISSLPLDWVKGELRNSRGKIAICGQFAKELSDTLNIPTKTRANFIPTGTETLLSLSEKNEMDVCRIHPLSLVDTLPKTDSLIITSPALGAFLVENPAVLSKLAYQIDRLILIPCLMPPCPVMALWGGTTSEMGTPEYPSGRFCLDPSQPAQLSLMNYRGDVIAGVFHFDIFPSAALGLCGIQIKCGDRSHNIEFDGHSSIDLSLTLVPGATDLEFRWLGPVVKDPMDKATSSFALRGLSFKDSAGVSLLSDKWAYTERQIDQNYCSVDESHIRSAIHHSGFNEVSGCMAGRISDRPHRLSTTMQSRRNLPPYCIDQGDVEIPHRSYFDIMWFSAYRLPQHLPLSEQKKHA